MPLPPIPAGVLSDRMDRTAVLATGIVLLIAADLALALVPCDRRCRAGRRAVGPAYGVDARALGRARRGHRARRTARHGLWVLQPAGRSRACSPPASSPGHCGIAPGHKERSLRARALRWLRWQACWRCTAEPTQEPVDPAWRQLTHRTRSCLYCLKGSRKTNRFGGNPLTPQPPRDTRPRWDQQSEIEFAPHRAGPPPAWHVKRGA